MENRCLLLHIHESVEIFHEFDKFNTITKSFSMLEYM